MTPFDRCLELVLIEEGGFSNHPQDPGGATNFGITKKTFEEWISTTTTVEKIMSLRVQDVRPIYMTKYWNPVRADDLPDGINLIVFDAAVNSGPRRAARWLQRCVHAEVDGAIGPKTLAITKTCDPAVVIRQYQQERLFFLQSLDIWKTFGKGWEKRVRRMQDSALKMLPQP
jgi:lysozyme family protein